MTLLLLDVDIWVHLYSAFEGASLTYFYYSMLNIFNLNASLVVSNNMFYMLISVFIFSFLYIHLSFINFFNIILNFIKSWILILKDIINAYIFYKKNIFFLFISYIFFSIVANNILGLLPFSNTINNHINITLMLSFICWLGICIIGFKCFSTYFISMFCVLGIPRILIPFLACIEFLSYLFRFVSLSLRLFANIVAGHILVETIYIFIYKMTFGINNSKITSFIIALLPSLFLSILILFELVISCLQGYIFIVLCLIYLKDSLYLH